MKANKNSFIGLGTNLGNRKENLAHALKEISIFAKITKKSSVYETPPVGYKKQRPFLNMVIKIKTSLSPQNLLKKLKETEKKMGRTKTVKNGPRIIDLDILFYGKEIVAEKNLKIPHPRLHERDFTLKPLYEISPGKIHPKLEKTIKTLLKEHSGSKKT
ncbi:MAG: 2-amino-4-hydroxy-6-hydroxymethyldihydropteridine diphosphokinase [Candidatus Peregrinibacteria bacterium]